MVRRRWKKWERQSFLAWKTKEGKVHGLRRKEDFMGKIKGRRPKLKRFVLSLSRGHRFPRDYAGRLHSEFFKPKSKMERRGECWARRGREKEKGKTENGEENWKARNEIFFKFMAKETYGRNRLERKKRKKGRRREKVWEKETESWAKKEKTIGISNFAIK